MVIIVKFRGLINEQINEIVKTLRFSHFTNWVSVLTPLPTINTVVPPLSPGDLSELPGDVLRPIVLGSSLQTWIKRNVS